MIVVTGAAGFIGSHLCDRLLSDGYRVRGVDCFTDAYERSRKEANLLDARASSRFELVEADLNSASLAPLLADADAIFHLAAQPGVRSSWRDSFEVYLRNNVAATQRLLEALRARPVPFVFASSSSVYGAAPRLPVGERDIPAPVSPYGVTKLAAEHLVLLYARAERFPAVALRYFTVYGPRQRPDMAIARFVDAALHERPVRVLGDGTQTRDFTFVGDAVDATVRALAAAPGSVYNVGGGTRASILDVVATVGDLVAPVEVLHEAPAAGDPPHTQADTTLARRELGWAPETSLRAGLERQVAWARDRATSVARAGTR